MKSLNDNYELVRLRAKGICEGKGCTEEHLTHAKTYKGKVVLTIKYVGKKMVNDPEKMILLCFKCSGHLDRLKVINRPKKKKVKGTNQVELFELLK